MSGFIAGLPAPENPEGYGYLGEYRIQSQEMPDINVWEPERVQNEIAQYNEAPPLPDIARVMKGTVDKNMAARMYAAAAGQDSGLVGITPEVARMRLAELGMPLDPNAWTPAEFDAKFAELAVQPSILSLLGFE